MWGTTLYTLSGFAVKPLRWYTAHTDLREKVARVALEPHVESDQLLPCNDDEWEVVCLEAKSCQVKTIRSSSVAVPATAASAVRSCLHCNLPVWVRARVFVCQADEHVARSSDKWEGRCEQGKGGRVWCKCTAPQSRSPDKSELIGGGRGTVCKGTS